MQSEQAIWLFAAVVAGAVLHAAPPEHDHPFRLLALRQERPARWALTWAAMAGALHLLTSLVLGWLMYHAGVGVLDRGGTSALLAGASAWCALYAVLTGFGGFTGHLQSPRTSLLRLEERRMKLLSPPSLASIEGLNPCLLPWAFWAAAAPAGLVASLSGAALWSLTVSACTFAKLWLRFPRHPRPQLGGLERRGDLLAGAIGFGALLYLALASTAS